MPRAMNPLPSLIRASATDAANMQMRAAGRSAWSEDDYDLAASTLERLITSCYGREGENQQEMKYIRFGVAEQAEKRGEIGLRSNWADVMARIECALSGPMRADHDRPMRVSGAGATP